MVKKEEIKVELLGHTPRVAKALDEAELIALQRGARKVGTDHVLIALFDEGAGIASQALIDLGVSREQLIAAINRLAPSEAPCSHCHGSGKAQ